MLKSIRPDQARMGMYVHAFEGGWLSHPLWRSRFLISSDKDLDRIRASESGIIIDTTKGSDIAPPPGRKGPSIPASMRAAGGFGRADQARAAELALRSTKVVKAMYEDCRLGRDVTTTDILSTVDDIADSLNNMAAFISVTRLKAQDDATYTHSVAVCALMISMARELGLPPEAVHDLGMAGLLHDIGKVSVNPSILLKAEALTDAELAELRRHPTIGHEILSAAQGIPAVALDVCLHHHERPDGSGYPFGLKQDAISQATRMASVCDVYDAMTSIRPYSATKSPLEAVTTMDQSPGQFDPALLFKFMGIIGVYAPGKLVRLQGTRLAVTLPQKITGMRPVFRAFYSTVDTHFIRYEDVMPTEGISDEDAVVAEDPASWFSESWPKMAARILAGERNDLYPHRGDHIMVERSHAAAR